MLGEVDCVAKARPVETVEVGVGWDKTKGQGTREGSTLASRGRGHSGRILASEEDAV
jgi:hypothetical protein